MTTTLSERIFPEAWHGLQWAASEVPGGSAEDGVIRIDGRPLAYASDPRPGGAFAVRASAGGLQLRAGSAIGAIGGLLELARRRRSGLSDGCDLSPRFRSRLYKHEIVFEGGGAKSKAWDGSAARLPITAYPAETMEGLCRELVRRHFGALVLYPGTYHPFEFFLAYGEMAHATHLPEDVRQRNREALRRFLGIARSYGLTTYLQHYVSHFTQGIADHLQLGLKEGGSRLAGIDHPEIDRYIAYAYRQCFREVPELSGLFYNFESGGDAAELLRRTLMPAIAELPRAPHAIFRLWGISDVASFSRLVRDYPGAKALKHKPHDTADVYSVPVADARVAVWKRALPDVEFIFSNGPCHNCGTNISNRLFTDRAYTAALLQDFLDKGADSMAFQSISELLLPLLPGREAFPAGDHHPGRLNQGHLDAVVDFVRGEQPSRATLTARTAARYGCNAKAATAIDGATLAASRIILDQYSQFWHGSAQEGYLYPGRFSHYQEPFFYTPVSFINRIGSIPHNVAWRAWAVRDRMLRVVPDDTQAPIDFANPAVRRKPARHPLAMAASLARHVATARRHLAAYRNEAGSAADPVFAGQVELNCLLGERIRREILIAVELCSCYFAASRRAFFAHLRRARDLMLETAKLLGDAGRRATDGFVSVTTAKQFDPAADAAAIGRILAHARDDFPFPALQAYLRSHERFNEIRRLCRPFVSVRSMMSRRNRGLLTQALRQAERSIALLDQPRHALLRDNVLAWSQHLRAELDALHPPAIACPPADALAQEQGFRPLQHDQCYRWGEVCWEDFASFFARHDFSGPDHCDFRVARTADGLQISLREHGIDWNERSATWDKNRGTVNQTGFLQVMIDPAAHGDRMLHYTLYFRGEGGTVASLREMPDGSFVRKKPSPSEGLITAFAHSDSNWRFDLTIPWAQLGGPPERGAIWRLNLLTNPSVRRNRRVIWCSAYEWQNEVHRMGRMFIV